jgi:hypothetical protein
MRSSLPGPLSVVKPISDIVMPSSLHGLGELTANSTQPVASSGVPWLSIGVIVGGAALGAAIGGHGASPEDKTSHEIIGGIVGGVLAIPAMIMLTVVGVVGTAAVVGTASQTVDAAKSP